MPKGVQNGAKMGPKFDEFFDFFRNGGFCENIVFSLEKQLPTQSDTAAPHRHRPLEARRLKARNQQASAGIGEEKQEKRYQNPRNVTKMGTQIDAKAAKNQSKIEAASRRLLGAASTSQMTQTPLFF